MSGTGFCDATSDDSPSPLTCDLRPGHEQERHEETGVASWTGAGSAATDLRWYVGVSRSTGRRVYRADPVLAGEAHPNG